MQHLEYSILHGTPSFALHKKLAINLDKWLCSQKFKDKILSANSETKLSKLAFFKCDCVHLNRQELNLLFSFIFPCLSDIFPFKN